MNNIDQSLEAIRQNARAMQEFYPANKMHHVKEAHAAKLALFEEFNSNPSAGKWEAFRAELLPHVEVLSKRHAWARCLFEGLPREDDVEMRRLIRAEFKLMEKVDKDFNEAFQLLGARARAAQK